MPAWWPLRLFLKHRTLRFPINGVLAVGLAAVLFWGIFCGDSAPILIGIKKKKRLEVTFDTFTDDIFPPGADLHQETKKKRRKKQGQLTHFSMPYNTIPSCVIAQSEPTCIQGYKYI